jgi:hypothetical protein
MTEKGHVLIPVWAENLEQVDREIARLALLCRVRLLDPGVIARVLANETWVCGGSNPLAFARLRDLLMLHFAIREKAAGAFGAGPTARIEDEIIERLRKSFPELAKEELPR